MIPVDKDGIVGIQFCVRTYCSDNMLLAMTFDLECTQLPIVVCFHFPLARVRIRHKIMLNFNNFGVVILNDGVRAFSSS